MQKERQYLQLLFQKYQFGLVTEEEKQIIARWLTSLDVNESNLDDIVLEVRGAKAREKLKSTIFDNVPVVATRKLYRKLLQVAAVLTLVLGITWLMTDKYHPSSGSLQVTKVQSRPLPAKKMYVNSESQPLRIVLPDASSVVLSAGSELYYLSDFGRGSRKVFLTGKAKFKVHKDVTRPFTVYADEVGTTALGTEFTVTELGASAVEVRLHEGKVVVKAKSLSGNPIKDIYLKPNEKLVLNRASGNVVVSQIRSTVPAVARPRVTLPVVELQFNQEQLADVFSRLEQHYHQKIDYENVDVNGLTFTGSIGTGDNLNDVLQIICSMNGLKITTDGNRIIIKRNNN